MCIDLDYKLKNRTYALPLETLPTTVYKLALQHKWVNVIALNRFWEFAQKGIQTPACVLGLETRVLTVEGVEVKSDWLFLNLHFSALPG